MSELSIPLAVILCGGRGTRLKPFTYVLPKPLVPVGDKPILLILIERLREQGILDIVLCVNYMADLLSSYFGDGSRFGVRIRYSLENEPLGTVAPVRRIADLPERFLVMNGDLLTDLDFRAFWQHHLGQKAPLTVGTYQRQVKVDFGVIDSENGLAVGFREKPEYHYEVSMGVYVFESALLDLVPNQGAFGFDELMHVMLDRGWTVNVFPYGGYWLDIGRPEDYEKAQEDVARFSLCLSS